MKYEFKDKYLRRFLSSFSNLFTQKPFVNELTEYIKDFELNTLESVNENYELELTDENNNELYIAVSQDVLSFLKNTGSQAERLIVSKMETDDIYVLTKETVEKRTEGVVYSYLQKQYFPMKDEYLLLNIFEDRFTFTAETLEEILKINYDEENATGLLWKLESLNEVQDFRNICDYSTEFSTHVPYDLENPKLAGLISATTYVNEIDVSDYYDCIYGQNKLQKIFDLYKGIINKDNMTEIRYMDKKVIPQRGFNLFAEEKQEEDRLVGMPLQTEKAFQKVLK